ncbi:MAG TPA: amidohydrolase family protein, partial [Candidatus Limnocylindrales bacterium]
MTPPADLVLVGRIATLAGTDGPGWAEAIAVSGGRVVAAGTAVDVGGLAGPGTRRLTLARDEVAVPGLTDAHLHLVDTALAGSRVALEGCGSIDELVDRVRAAAGPDLERWIEGGGWDPDALGR